MQIHVDKMLLVFFRRVLKVFSQLGRAHSATGVYTMKRVAGKLFHTVEAPPDVGEWAGMEGGRGEEM